MDREMKLLDANIFLEYLLEDKRWEEVEKFLEKVLKEGILAVTTDFIVFSIILRIWNEKKSFKAMKIL